MNRHIVLSGFMLKFQPQLLEAFEILFWSAEILLAEGSSHLVVSHKSILRALLCVALGLPEISFRAVDIHNGGICVFRQVHHLYFFLTTPTLGMWKVDLWCEKEGFLQYTSNDDLVTYCSGINKSLFLDWTIWNVTQDSLNVLMHVLLTGAKCLWIPLLDTTFFSGRTAGCAILRS